MHHVATEAVMVVWGYAVWDKLQREARRNGWLVFAMHQGETVYVQDGKYGVPAGYCLGMSCEWLSEMYQGKTFAYGSNRVCALPPLKGVRVHAITRKLNDGSDEITWVVWDAALREYDLYRDANLALEDSAAHTPKPAEMAAKLCRVMLKSPGGYTMDFMGTGGGHALAMFRSAGQFDLFDANHGHFRFAESAISMSGALEWFLDGTAYMEKLHTMTRICKVNRPYDHTTTSTDSLNDPTYERWVWRTLPSEKVTLARVEEPDVELVVRRPKPRVVQTNPAVRPKPHVARPATGQPNINRAKRPWRLRTHWWDIR